LSKNFFLWVDAVFKIPKKREASQSVYTSEKKEEKDYKKKEME